MMPDARPQWVHDEMGAVGCALIVPTAIDEMLPLSPEDFGTDLHRVIWWAICHLRSTGTDVTLPTIAGALRQSLADQPDLLQSVIEYLPKVINATMQIHAAAHYATAVRQWAILRRVGAVAQEIVTMAQVDDLRAIEKARTLALAAAGAEPLAQGISLEEAVTDALNDIEARLRGDVPPPVPTGIPRLDTVNAFRPGDLVIAAGRPGMGKSILAAQVALQAAASGRPVVFISLEMSARQIVFRALAAQARLDAWLLAGPDLNDEEWARLVVGAAELAPRPLTIIDRGEITTETICAQARRHVATTGLALLVVDYLQLLPTPAADSGRVALTDALGAISRRLKRLAQELGIVVLALSQLSRAGDGERPSLTHLRSSGSLEQDADTVLLLSPELADGMDAEDWRAQIVRPLHLDVAKNRNGPLRDIPLYFDTKTLSMREALL